MRCWRTFPGCNNRGTLDFLAGWGASLLLHERTRVETGDALGAQFHTVGVEGKYERRGHSRPGT